MYMAPGGDAHAGLADKVDGFNPLLVQTSFGSTLLWFKALGVESTVGLKALWRRTFVTTTRILLTFAIGDGSSRHQEISAFYEGSGKEQGCGAAFPVVVVTWVLQGQGMENSATGVGGTDAKPGGDNALLGGYQAWAGLDVAAQGRAANCARCWPRRPRRRWR